MSNKAKQLKSQRRKTAYWKIQAKRFNDAMNVLQKEKEVLKTERSYFESEAQKLILENIELQKDKASLTLDFRNLKPENSLAVPEDLRRFVRQISGSKKSDLFNMFDIIMKQALFTQDGLIATPHQDLFSDYNIILESLR